jgi:ABC-2 type transport system ATP-binding protein
VGERPAISVERLCKRFGARATLDGVTFSVPAGEVFGLVGPNGAGKTTTLRILATLLPADEGRVTVGGITLDEEPGAARAAIGYLPDFFGLYDRLTAA